MTKKDVYQGLRNYVKLRLRKPIAYTNSSNMHKVDIGIITHVKYQYE